jgi:hypothetical protein
VVFLAKKHRPDYGVVSTRRRAERAVNFEHSACGAAAWWLDQTLATC